MPRLPLPGQDDGAWGTILNDFLTTELINDGSANAGQLKIRHNGTLSGKESTVNKGAAGGYAPLDSNSKVPTVNLPAAVITPDADGTTKGVIRLGGDLSGTATNPTVLGLADKYIKPSSGIPASDLADNAVTTSKIADSTISAAKLNTSINTTLSSAQTAVQNVNGKTGNSISLKLTDLNDSAISNPAEGDAIVRTGSSWTTTALIPASQKGVSNGVATLGSDGKVPTSQISAVSSDIRIPTLFTAGNSYAAGGGIVGTTAYQQAMRPSGVISRLVGATETNVAVNGSALMTDNKSPSTPVTALGGWVNIMQNVKPVRSKGPYASTLYAATLDHGINDIAFYGPLSSQTKFLDVWKMTLRACIARLRAGAVWEDSDTAVTYPTGTWTNAAISDANSGASVKTATVAGSIRLTVPADFKGGSITFQCLAGYSGSPGGTATLTYTVDSVAAGSESTVGHVLNNAEFVPWVKRFTNLSAGAHTIDVSISNVVGAFYFDCFSAQAEVVPVVILGDIFRLPGGYSYGTGWANAKPSDADVQAVNQATRDVAAEFDNLVIVDDADTAIVKKLLSSFESDQLHPNAATTAAIGKARAQKIRAAISGQDFSLLGVPL